MTGSPENGMIEVYVSKEYAWLLFLKLKAFIWMKKTNKKKTDTAIITPKKSIDILGFNVIDPYHLPINYILSISYTGCQLNASTFGHFW